ncbi:MAG: DUF3883 domain-containing protein [Chloroflexi bacterium]|nr:DUF3883 domain-containing protein [Chloroflexota bacterium]
MASDYERISQENLEEYGRNRTGWREDLLVDLYPDRTHFVFELLQNAEDALRRLNAKASSSRVGFVLADDAVRFSHYGDPFTTEDVRGVCAIARRAKESDLTAIGRFGIGFKSVYAITDNPEVHSGDEHFTVTDYVQPAAVPPIPLAVGETAITLPLKEGAAADDIAGQFERLADQRTLLFLRAIDEIAWSGGEHSGLHRREEVAEADGVRRVKLLSEVDGEHRDEEVWLVFSREVRHEEKSAGYVELAFRMMPDADGEEAIDIIRDSHLAAFFPTEMATGLGMLVQGPYRTTPARDNIPRDDDWNRYLVEETARLLVEVVRCLRDRRLLTARTFEALPLDRARFSGGFFAPLFNGLRNAIWEEPLLPSHRGGYVAASRASITDDPRLRDLVSRQQLAELRDEDEPVAWLAGDISRDETPELHRYLTDEQDVERVGTSGLLESLWGNTEFLKAQTDRWIQRLYSYLGRRTVRPHQLRGVPLLRIEDGTQVRLGTGPEPAAFLPTEPPSGFPNTVRQAVCTSKPAREFLESLRLSEPDLVDELVRNTIPKYRHREAVGAAQYGDDLRRITQVYRGASRDRRDRLVEVLRDVPFVRVVDAGNDEHSFACPKDAYLATRRLRDLFKGVKGVLLAAPPRLGKKLDGEVAELFESCGARSTLATIERRESKSYVEGGWNASDSWEPFGITAQKRLVLRLAEGEAEITHGKLERLTNKELRGLEALLEHMPTLPGDDVRARTRLLWDALRDSPKDAFTGAYEWFRRRPYRHPFPSEVVRLLAVAAWVPDGSGRLQTPDRVEFASLGWTADRYLESVVNFRLPERPSRLAVAAEEAGVSVEVFEQVVKLKAQGVGDEAILEWLSEYRPRSGRPDSVSGDGAGPDGASSLLPVDAGGLTQVPGGSRGDRDGPTTGRDGAGGGSGVDVPTRASGAGAGVGEPRFRFISYIAAQAESENDPDPDGLSHERRMALERSALDYVVALESSLQRTPPNNPGFDLYETEESGTPVRWVEVKALSRDLRSRPATLTHTQFDYARAKGKAYWLYVVEHAGTDRANLVKIADPAGRASTYTFDEGWRDVATALPERQPQDSNSGALPH